MDATIIIGLLVTAFTACVYLGFRLAKSETRADEAEQVAKVRGIALKALGETFHKTSKLNEDLKKIATIDDPTELNGILRKVFNHMPDRNS